MAHFAYAALDSSGKTRKGHVEAASKSAAISKLRGDGLTPFDISATNHTAGAIKTEAPKPFWRRKIHFGKRAGKAAVAAMTRQLSTLLQAGIPLDRALSAIYSSGGQSSVGEIAASLHETIIGGKDLAAGLAAWPGVFSTTFTAMIQAGESSGTLDIVMERLASHLEQEVAMRRKIRSALAYPAFMLVVGLAVVIFLLSFVIPQVTKIFAEMGRELPVPTRILLGLSDGLRHYWWVILIVLSVIFLVAWRWFKTGRGKRFLDSRIFGTPIAGAIYRQNQLGNFARTLGMLLKNGVPLLKGLRIVKAASANLLVMESIEKMTEGVQAGRELSDFMGNEILYPSIARQMVSAGEKSGRLAEMLLWVADDAESQVEARLQALTSLLEPAMILALGGLVGFVVIAIILPIFEMSTLAG